MRVVEERPKGYGAILLLWQNRGSSLTTPATQPRSLSDQVITQHVWGLTYVDELVQVGHNDDPADAEQLCESFYWACQDANYNVLGLVDSEGVLVERYEYTPYGQRTVFFSPGLNDPGCNASTSISRRRTYAGENQPWGLCAFGHQGLMHDEETGNIYNRARILSPNLDRFMQRDPLDRSAFDQRFDPRIPANQYSDGMSVYQYLRGSPTSSMDSAGLQAETCQAVGAPFWEKTWNYVDTLPGYATIGTSAGAAPVSGVNAFYMGVYVKRLAQLTYCCDVADSGFYEWRLNAIGGVDFAARNYEAAPAIEIATPLPIPVGYGQAIDIGSIIKLPKWYAWVAPPQKWSNHPPSPALIGPTPPLDCGTATDNTKIPLLKSVSCSCGIPGPTPTGSVPKGVSIPPLPSLR